MVSCGGDNASAGNKTPKYEYIILHVCDSIAISLLQSHETFVTSSQLYITTAYTLNKTLKCHQITIALKHPTLFYRDRDV